MRTFAAYLIATIVFAAGSWAAPWEFVPVAAAILALLVPARFTPFRLTVAAAVAWGAILGWTALFAPAATLARELAGIYHVPGWLLALLTPALAALLAWAGAAIAVAVRERARPVADTERDRRITS